MDIYYNVGLVDHSVKSNKNKYSHDFIIKLISYNHYIYFRISLSFLKLKKMLRSYLLFVLFSFSSISISYLIDILQDQKKNSKDLERLF